MKDLLGKELSPGDFVVYAKKNDLILYLIEDKYKEDQCRVLRFDSLGRWNKYGNHIFGLKKSIIYHSNLCIVEPPPMVKKVFDHFRKHPNVQQDFIDQETMMNWYYGRGYL